MKAFKKVNFKHLTFWGLFACSIFLAFLSNSSIFPKGMESNSNPYLLVSGCDLWMPFFGECWISYTELYDILGKKTVWKELNMGNVIISEEKHIIVYYNRSEILVIRDLKNKRIKQNLYLMGRPLMFSPKGNFIFTKDNDTDSILIYDANNFALIKKISIAPYRNWTPVEIMKHEYLGQIACSNDEKYLVIFYDFPNIFKIVSLENYKEITVHLPNITNEYFNFFLTPDSKYLIINEAFKNIIVFDFPAIKLLYKIDGKICACTMNTNGKTLACNRDSGLKKFIIDIFDITTGMKIDSYGPIKAYLPLPLSFNNDIISFLDVYGYVNVISNKNKTILYKVKFSKPEYSIYFESN